AELGGAEDRLLAYEHAPSAPYRYLLYFGPEPLDEREREVVTAVAREARFAAVEPPAAVEPLAAEADLSPTTDDRPFFFHTEAYAPGAVWAIALTPALLALLLARRRRDAGAPGRGRAIALLSGAGFASLELLLVQRALAAVGFPVLALAAVVVSLLAGSAAGALLGGRGRPWPTAVPAAALAVVAVVLGV